MKQGCPYHAGHYTEGSAKMISCRKPGGEFEIITQYTNREDYAIQIEAYCNGRECTYRYCEIYLVLNGWKDARQYEMPGRLSRYDAAGEGKTLQVHNGTMREKALPPRRAAGAPRPGTKGRSRAETGPSVQPGGPEAAPGRMPGSR